MDHLGKAVKRQGRRKKNGATNQLGLRAPLIIAEPGPG